MWRHHNMFWKWPQFASKLLQELLLTWLYRFCFPISANNKHSLLHSIPIHFPTILCELTHYTNTHEQQLYCVGTLSQMTERSAERRVRQETGWLAGGPLLRVAKIRRTTDTHYRHISHTTNVLLFKFHCNIFIGIRIIKEIPGSVASGTLCIIRSTQRGWLTSKYVHDFLLSSLLLWRWAPSYFLHLILWKGTVNSRQTDRPAVLTSVASSVSSRNFKGSILTVRDHNFLALRRILCNVSD